jgi:hypothetical protein
MRPVPLAAALIISLLAVRCASPADGAEEAAAEPLHGPPNYRDVEEGFTSEAEQERWFELSRALQRDFDQVCGDTFCEGDFSNLASLAFRCSVAVRTGALKSCLWLFAGSYETVTPSNGIIHPVARIFQCRIPVQGTLATLLDALLVDGTDVIHRPLPGQTTSVYDALTGCL